MGNDARFLRNPSVKGARFNLMECRRIRTSAVRTLRQPMASRDRELRVATGKGCHPAVQLARSSFLTAPMAVRSCGLTPMPPPRIVGGCRTADPGSSVPVFRCRYVAHERCSCPGPARSDAIRPSNRPARRPSGVRFAEPRSLSRLRTHRGRPSDSAPGRGVLVSMRLMRTCAPVSSSA
jgi:hypothetical protein